MLSGSTIFLRWAGPPLELEDPRLDAAVPEDPEALAGLCRWPNRVADGPAEALRALRDGLGSRDDGRRIVVGGGESPELLAAIDAGFRRPGDSLVLVAPDADGVSNVESLALALEAAPRGRSIIVQGAVAATGAAAPLGELGIACREHRASLILDLTLARFTPLAAASAALCQGALAALDRWDGEPAGTWGVTVGGVPDWTENPPATLQHLDAALRGTLASQAPVTVWPTIARRHAIGVVAFSVAEWSGEEAAELLSQAFGVVLEAGPLTAAPLPFPDRWGRGLLRASIAPSTTPDDIAALGTAVARLARSRLPAGVSH